MGKKIFGFDMDKKWDYENGFYLTSDLKRIPKMLAQYEIYKLITNLPGHVVECGVFKGSSLMRLCTFREILESPFSRKIIGFDAFGSFPRQDNPLDDAFINEFEEMAGTGISKNELSELVRMKGFKNVELIEGNLEHTLPGYIEERPELQISLLHVDVDVYRPTLTILNHLFDRVVPGGVIIFDNYAVVPGETQAVGEFIREANIELQLRKMPISHMPTYCVKKNTVPEKRHDRITP